MSNQVCFTCGELPAPVVVQEGVIELCVKCAGDWIRSAHATTADYAKQWHDERVKVIELEAGLKTMRQAPEQVRVATRDAYFPEVH